VAGRGRNERRFVREQTVAHWSASQNEPLVLIQAPSLLRVAPLWLSVKHSASKPKKMVEKKKAAENCRKKKRTTACLFPFRGARWLTRQIIYNTGNTRHLILNLFGEVRKYSFVNVFARHRGSSRHEILSVT
jgi:hypothetical protein